MTFEDIVDQAVAMLQRLGQVTYRTLKRQFDLDDEALEDLKDQLLFSHPVIDQDGRGLLWTGASEPPTLEAERRQLTVMFCDVVDSTTLSGQLDPEDYRDVLRAYQATCSAVIQRFDGYIAQHLGDALLVYFGFPVAHEDAAPRAIHTGLGMLAAMQTLNTRLQREQGIHLSMRVGLHTGLTVIGDIGEGQKQELLALGEAPNVASRIQGIAAPDTIAISADTYRLIEGYFAVEDLGRHALKGVQQPMQVYRVLQESDAHSRLDSTRSRGLTPLIGREHEVGVLLERWQQVKAGQGQVVVLSGEAGIGKSRLVQVLKERVAEAAHSRLECRSSPYYQHTALYPVTDMLQRTLQWHPDDTPAQRLEKLVHTLSPYRLPLDETVPLFAALLSLPLPEERYAPLHWTSQRQRQKTLESLVALLLEQAERQPVLFILEDLHWTDPTTLEFLDLLLDHIPTAAIGAVLTCRPAFQQAWSPRSALSAITVNRLSRPQIVRLAEQVAGGKRLPPNVLQHMVEKTDGVPLFVEEMTKAVLESEALQEVNGTYNLVGSLAALAIPTTLQDSLMARLDRLVTAKGVAQYAAVIGRQFSYAVLQAVAALDNTVLARELGLLVGAELVYQHGLPPQATYTFKHALIQDIACQSLLRSTRQRYHRRIADVLVEQFPETKEAQPELLAHHYTEAGLAELAIGYWQRAGQQASERSAYQEAISHLTTGLSLLQTLPETLSRQQQELSLQTALGTAALISKGAGAPETGAAYTRARLLCQQLGDTQDVFPVLFGLWRFHITRADYSMGRQLGEELLDLAERRDEWPLYVGAYSAVGTTCMWMGELHLAQRHLEAGSSRYRYASAHRRFPMFRAGQDPGVACRAFGAWTLWLLGYPEQALAGVRNALALAAELDHPFSHAFAHDVASIVCQFRRQAQEVYDHAAAVITLSTEQGFTYWLAQMTFLQGWALTALGQHEQGLTQMRQGLIDLRATGAEVFVPYFLMLLAEGYGHLNRVHEGLDALQEAFESMQRMGTHFWKAEGYRLQGVLLLQQVPPEVDEAETCFHQALNMARQQQAKSLELRAATGLARLWQSQDKRQAAYDLLAPVYGWFTEGFDTVDLQAAKALLQELG